MNYVCWYKYVELTTHLGGRWKLHGNTVELSMVGAEFTAVVFFVRYVRRDDGVRLSVVEFPGVEAVVQIAHRSDVSRDVVGASRMSRHDVMNIVEPRN
uniref:Phage protein n=1 Tax=Steinernema glaseri TaxID=37863 RepID=A0A1I7YL59_9BILA